MASVLVFESRWILLIGLVIINDKHSLVLSPAGSPVLGWPGRYINVWHCKDSFIQWLVLFGFESCWIPSIGLAWSLYKCVASQ